MASAAPLDIPLCRPRGDTVPDQFRFGTVASPVNITGFTFELVMDTQKEPSGTGTNVHTLTGIITDGPNGLFEFPYTDGEANHVGEFFYDVQLIDGGGKKRTIIKSTYDFTQDINKS